MIGLADLVEIIDRNENPEDFFEYTKLQMFQENVFCFTPKGSVIKFQKMQHQLILHMLCILKLEIMLLAVKLMVIKVNLQSILRNGDVVKYYYF